MATDSLAGLLFDTDTGAQASPILHAGACIYTGADVRAGAEAVAARLDAAGAGAGTCVAVMAPNTAATVAAYFGVWAAGATLVPVNPRLTATEVGRVLDAVRPAAVVEAGGDGGLSAVVRPGAAPPLAVDAGTAVVSFTSGTTGAPKPVRLRHDRVLAALDAVLATLAPSDPAKPRRTRPNIVAFPLSMWSGVYTICFSLRVGAPLVVMERFDPAELVRLASLHDVRSVVLAPAMLSALLHSPDVAGLGPLRMVRNGTAALAVPVARAFHDRFGVPVLNGYGQTELGGEVVGWSAADVREFGDTKIGSVGRPHAGVDLRIDDGELLVRSPFAMAGHLDDAATAERVTADGYVRTGDLADVDADGFVWIVGRRSDVVNRSGLKVHPDEVEAALLEHPGVRDAGVCAVADERVGEVPWAFVVAADPAEPPEPAALEAHCRERLAAYKVPAAFVRVDALPRNDAGKLLRRELPSAHT